ncbi:bifunctional 2-C-methyl-D-erythritol 4-phosphate cytidylyltransferase/2-C-methyl-D-erythritol 2,4-cyclodiphosphate synthase [Pararhodobacter aggregans]|uniref:bifunctional 2-C-methyl-D-erythritol 4-phosphate cytidylyltransferase/2-C-methyl-D-erythritol 2,4-cyclodiphosphate synthase n=1 Tax=Pararhodobacter aggregans TaxID=404875 RepID=UPI003A92AA43
MSRKDDIAVILVAAGRGSRMGGGLPKQWRLLAGQPVLAHTVAAFRAAGLDRILLVIHPDDRPRAEALGLPLVEGGASRSDSVRAALAALASDPPARVLIHDAARPLVEPSLIAGVLEALTTHPAAAPALPVVDALWRGEAGAVAGLQPRDGLFRAQTPQGFDFAALSAAYDAHPGDAADDVAVAMAAGLRVAITPGSERNLKLTYPEDFTRAEQMLAERSAMDIRLGNGFDVHAFTEGDHVWLCGVKVPHTKALLGHSDADVGMHALTDALYGAMADGDIGRHFPPTDPQWKGAASHIFLRHAGELARSRGFTISNCDVTLICERPKVGPHATAMQAALADILGLDAGRVSVKATTSERLGFTGREEGIAAIATATLVKA